ncbi:T9SS type A sorting domain-containing protein [Flavobacterium stagni]|uniref:T9SS type A sorting domain-containing protein n=2 Tax=Flavobacterium stagni TaxID=2506421 RepID=A0A4Q1K9D0_9FLAO|nr:T9SS type A sorting domain-containing protein [Flavobacterium stagni]
MKKITILTFILFFCFQNMKAQNYNWARYVSTANGSNATDVAVDSQGNTYTVGHFLNSVDFNPSPTVNNSINESSTSVGNIFCTKYDQNGNFLWAIPVGGKNNLSANGPFYGNPRIEIDKSSGYIYITGDYDAYVIDFDPGPGTFFLPPPQNSTANGTYFLAKYTTNGTFVWAKTFSQLFSFSELDTDSQGNVYLIGNFSGTIDLDPSDGIYNLVSAGNQQQFFLLKLNSNGEFIWANQFGDPTKVDTVWDVGVDNQDNIYIGGLFKGTMDMDPSAGQTILQSPNTSDDAFLAKYNSNGELLWAQMFASQQISVEVVYSIAFDTNNNVYCSGSFSGDIDFDNSSNTFNLSPVGFRSLFILKLSSNGQFIFAKTIGTIANNTENVLDIKVDNLENLYLTGSFVGTLDCDPDAGTYLLTNQSGNNDVFIVALSSTNGQFHWAKSFGSTYYDDGRRMAIHPNSNRITLVGSVYNTTTLDFDPPNGVYFTPGIAGYGTFLINYTRNSLSNNEDLKLPSIALIPNPSNNFITIDSSEPIDYFQLFDWNGKCLMTKNNSTILNVQDLPPGVYLLEIKSNNVLVSKKVVVSN